MDFETFRENLARDIKETLEARTGTDFEVEHRTAEKMNGNYEAIVVKPADSEVGVSLNASTLYRDYESGVPYETIAKGATDLADRSLRNQPEFDVDSFKDYDKMKGTLAMEVVSKERNAELLDTVPHKDIEDISVVYHFVLGETPAGSGTIIVTNQMLENYGITADQLHADAMKTAPEVRPLVIEGMGQVLAKQMGVEDLEVLGLNIPPEQEQMLGFEEFTNLYNAAQGEPEFEICFINQRKTYMIIKYDDHVSFQRCGDDDGSGEFDYPSLEELYQTESVDGIRLRDKWDGIETIIADGTYDLSIQEELDSFKVFRDIH